MITCFKSSCKAWWCHHGYDSDSKACCGQQVIFSEDHRSFQIISQDAGNLLLHVKGQGAAAHHHGRLTIRFRQGVDLPEFRKRHVVINEQPQRVAPSGTFRPAVITTL